MSCFVKGGKLLLFFINDAALLFRSEHNFENSLGNVMVYNFFCVMLGCIECRFIQEVGQIRTGKPGGHLCNFMQVNILAYRFAFGMYFKDGFSSFDVGTHDNYPAVKSARSQQSRIKNIHTVCRCNNNDALVRTESIHFNEQLVQCLLTLIMSAAHSGTAVTS